MTDLKTLEKQAIKASLDCQWPDAIKLNRIILKVNPRSVSTLNRLARAYWENGEIVQAKKTYELVLSIDQYEPIATKNLKRLAGLKDGQNNHHRRITNRNLFLEEPGKTKVVKLIRLASPKVLANFSSGDQVNLVPKRRLISITDPSGIHLGCIPEDLSQRLLTLTKGGNQYTAVIKAIDQRCLEVFIREVKRGVRFKNQPSFPPTISDFIPQPADEEIQEEALDLTPTGEEEDAEV